MRSTCMSLIRPYRSGGCLLSWRPRTELRRSLASAGHSHARWINSSRSSPQNLQICSETSQSVQPGLCLMAGGEAFPSCPSSVVREILDGSLSNFEAISQVHLFQEPSAPEEMTPEMIPTNAIQVAPVPAPDPECRLSCHALGKQIKRHNTQNSFQASSGSGAMHMCHSQQT